jgi:inorganic pyrophosphatase
MSSKTKTGTIDVVVETPKGSRCKFSFDEEQRSFRLKSILPTGASFPYDFGFIPGTKAGDGDPLDVLLLVDAPTFTGCIVEARLIGVLEAEQKDDGELQRNDRIIAVASESKDYADIESFKELNGNFQDELAHFFVSYNQARGKEFKILGRKGPQAAWKIANAAKVRKKKKRMATS